MRDVIPEKLWIGNAIEARQITDVLNLGVRAIVDLAMEEAPAQFPRDILYLRIPLVDGGGNDKEILDISVNIVSRLIQAAIPTLVCCSAGMSRSPAVVAAALATARGNSLENTITELFADHPADMSPALLSDIVAVLDL